MARDWFTRNSNAGNVLHTKKIEIDDSATVTPDANINAVVVTMSGIVTITGANGNSFPMDKCTIIGINPTGGPLAITLAGTFEAGSLTVLANESITYEMIFNGQDWKANDTLV